MIFSSALYSLPCHSNYLMNVELKNWLELDWVETSADWCEESKKLMEKQGDLLAVAVAAYSNNNHH